MSLTSKARSEGAAPRKDDKRKPLPDLLTGRRDVPQVPIGAEKPWTVVPGEPSVNLDERRMAAPDATDDRSAVQRVWAMMAARVSPSEALVQRTAEETEVPLSCYEAAEAQRVTRLVQSLGYDTDLLNDPKLMRATGQMDGANPEGFGKALESAVRLSGQPKAQAAYISGLKKSDKGAPWVKRINGALDHFDKSYYGMYGPRAQRKLTPQHAKRVANTEEQQGWHHYTRQIADYIRYHTEQERSARARAAELAAQRARVAAEAAKAERGEPANQGNVGKMKPSEQRKQQDEGAAEYVRSVLANPDPKYNPGSPGGQWFEPVVLLPDRPTRPLDGSLFHKRVPSNRGRTVRFPTRLIVDPERRIFQRKLRAPGGVVLVDMSGSMALGVPDLEYLLAAVPGCLVIGQSGPAIKRLPNGDRVTWQGCGQDLDLYNGPGTWERYNTAILAENGRIVSEIPDLGGGNGNDGTALEFALSKRRPHEPIVWVTDFGFLTPGVPYCAAMCRLHGVWQVDKVSEALWALQQGRSLTQSYRFSDNVTRQIENAEKALERERSRHAA